MKTRLEILNKVANKELTPIEAENQLLVLSDVMLSEERTEVKCCI